MKVGDVKETYAAPGRCPGIWQLSFLKQSKEGRRHKTLNCLNVSVGRGQKHLWLWTKFHQFCKTHLRLSGYSRIGLRDKLTFGTPEGKPTVALQSISFNLSFHKSSETQQDFLSILCLQVMTASSAGRVGALRIWQIVWPRLAFLKLLKYCVPQQRKIELSQKLI